VKGRLRAQIIKELLSLFRDPRSRAVLIGPPLMQLFLFAFSVTLDVENVDIAVLNEDAGRASYEMLARVRGAGFVDAVTFVDNPAALAAMIDGRNALLALHFPSDFSRDIAAGRPAQAQVLIDGRRANAGQVAFSYLNAIATGYGAELSAGDVQSPRSEVRYWYNPNLQYRWFVLPSLAAMLAIFSSLVVTALSIARERELGTFDQLLVSPAQPIEIILGKTVPALLIGTVLGMVMTGIGILIFRVPFTGSLLALFALLVLFVLSVVGIGLMISSICQTQQQAVLGSFATMIPMVLTSGFATPVENMPQVLQMAAQANPLKHFLIIVQASFLKAAPIALLWDHAWPLLIIAAVTMTSAVLFVRGRLQ
jgi:ABC-2 type transport system permease protein